MHILILLLTLFKPETITALSLCGTYVAELIYYQNKVWIYFNARSTNKVYDKYGHDRSFISILLLLVKNVYFHKEEIYLEEGLEAIASVETVKGELVVYGLTGKDNKFLRISNLGFIKLNHCECSTPSS